ncbi:MAG: tRNA lysidine(34) synthetase TilS [Tenericutes bacterium]|nr:tRNA lysidine(34) synthetase TilS [Mycoplasmatota bacterium]
MKHIINYMKNQLKINTKLPLVVSVSGGIDSMALLTILVDSPYKIVVVHFNHLKREESVIEKDLVEAYCKNKEIPFHYYTIEATEGNFHHHAHHLRKHYLVEVAKMYKTPYILTAHHLDDLFENILIKLTRGSNLLGYAGMQMVHQDGKYIYVKPFLYTSRHEINKYVIENKVKYLDDASNEDNYYLRNRYRHAVVPIMKQENEQLLEQIKQYNQQVSTAFYFIRKTTKSLISDKMMINLDEFKLWDPAIQDDSIAYLIEHHKLALSYEIINKIKDMLLSSHPNQNYTLSNDFAFVKTYSEASIKQLSKVKPLKTEVKEGDNKLGSVAIFTFLNKTDVNTTDFTKLCYNKLAFPLWIRRRKDGDTLTYDYGHKKLKKLFIDLKVPLEKRNRLWVLTDNEDNILWVQNYYINETLGDKNCFFIKLKEVKKHA